MVFNFFTITTLINLTSCLVLGIFVFAKNKKGQKNLSFFIFSMTSSLWLACYFVWHNSAMNSEQTALLWTRILSIFIILIPATYFHFCLAVAEKVESKKFLLILNYIIFGSLALTALTPYFVERVAPAATVNYWPMASSLFKAYLVVFFLFVGYGFLLLIQKYRTSVGVAKLQLRYIAIGTIITFVSGSMNFLPWFQINIFPWGHALTPAYVFCMAYAITRYKLMDIKVLARNILFYLVLSFSFYALFFSVGFFYTRLFGSIFAKESFIVGAFLAVIVATIMYIGGKYFFSFINRYIFSSVYTYQQAIKSSSEQLGRYGNLDKIAGILSTTIQETIEPERLAITFVDENKKVVVEKMFGFQNKEVFIERHDLFARFFRKYRKIFIKDEVNELLEKEQNNSIREVLVSLKNVSDETAIILAVPASDERVLSGIIFLGEKSDKEPYTREDFNFLEILCRQAQTAIENALLYKKIEEKSKYLQELLEAKSDFIRIANHQLNTPLSIMRNAHSMVKDGSLSAKKGMVYIENGLERISLVLRDFWEVMQLEGERELELQKTDIGLLVRKIVREKKKGIDVLNKNIIIKIVKPEFKIPTVVCDIKITYVIHVLLDNAIAYTPAGRVDVSYELNEEKKYIKLNIKDTGIGFTKEDKEKIAQKFFRSKNALLSYQDGSGLGLYISKKIVEANGGELTYKSDGINQGSTFSITIPLHNEELAIAKVKK